MLWAEVARRDLDDIVGFIAADSDANARAVLDRIEHAAEKLARLPEQGRWLPELKRLSVLSYREIVVRPWCIVYRISPPYVYVLGVLDGRRDLGALLLQRLIR